MTTRAALARAAVAGMTRIHGTVPATTDDAFSIMGFCCGIDADVDAFGNLYAATLDESMVTALRTALRDAR